jgi:sulfatase maturation enzyme AslB (radical SAM superfamily)
MGFNNLREVISGIQNPFISRVLKSTVKKKAKKKRKIDFLNLTLTYQCQLKCSMCGQVEVPDDAPNSQSNWTQLPLDTVKERVDELSDELVSIYLFGGEPLIYPHIFELSEYLINKKISFSYSTNGLLLKRYTKSILDNPPDLISVSMDGCSSELHDSIRGLKGSWKKAMTGIEHLLNERRARKMEYPKLKIHFTITPDNYQTVREFYEFYTRQFPDIDFIKFHVPRFATKEMGIEYFELMQDQFDTHCLSYLGNFSEDQFVIDCQTKINAPKLYEDIKWVLTKEKSAFLGPTDKQEFIRYFTDPSYVPQERNCICRRSLSVQPNGDIANCGDYPDLCFGNIKTDTLEEAFSSSKAMKWKSYLANNPNPGVLAKCSRLYKTTYGPTNI